MPTHFVGYGSRRIVLSPPVVKDISARGIDQKKASMGARSPYQERGPSLKLGVEPATYRSSNVLNLVDR